MIVELFQSASCNVPDTTYFGVSFMNGAPGSCSAVRRDHAGANSSKVWRPSRIALHGPMIPPMASPIFGSNPYSIVQRGASNTPSRLMNSCTRIWPMMTPLDLVCRVRACCAQRRRPRARREIIAVLQPAAFVGGSDGLDSIPSPRLGDRRRQVIANGPLGQEQLLRDVGHRAAGSRRDQHIPLARG